MLTMTHEFTTLHERPDLLEDAARLLISEWPRSLEARKASIQSSKSTLPCSLLLLDNDSTGSQKVIGFARVLEVAGDSSAALVESVVIEPSLRGQGLGRKLMEACEDHVMKLGINSMYLSTHDKQEFYRHLGYTDGPAKTALRHNAKLIQNSLASVIAASTVEVKDEKVSTSEMPCNQNGQSSVIEPTNQGAPPPPAPPPPPKISTANDQEKTCITWMVKHLHSKCNS